MVALRPRGSLALKVRCREALESKSKSKRACLGNDAREKTDHISLSLCREIHRYMYTTWLSIVDARAGESNMQKEVSILLHRQEPQKALRKRPTTGGENEARSN